MNTSKRKTPAPKAPPPMSELDFARWGLAEVAYVKPLQLAGRTVFGVFAADGRQMGVMPNPDAARVTLLRNDLEQASVH